MFEKEVSLFSTILFIDICCHTAQRSKSSFETSDTIKVILESAHRFICQTYAKEHQNAPLMVKTQNCVCFVRTDLKTVVLMMII